MNTDIPKRLFRYTTLPIMLDMLCRRKLVLVCPQKWHNLPGCDKNDIGSMKAYQRTGKAVYVLCFTTENETNLYWDSLGGGVDCRIEFMGQELVKSLTADPGIRSGPVVYKKITELEAEVSQNPLDPAAIPFIKRWPYRAEKEYRIIWEGKITNEPPLVKEFDISLDLISRITISDGIHETNFNSIKEIIKKAITDAPQLSQVTIHENNRWIDCFKA